MREKLKLDTSPALVKSLFLFCLVLFFSAAAISQTVTGTVKASEKKPVACATIQTSLLLAEAAKRGWVTGGDAAAQTYYENAIRADMAMYSIYPGITAISNADINGYLVHPSIAYNPTDALKLINTQYWIVNIRNGTEAWANFRRSSFPALSPNLFNNNLNGGFVRRMSYPNVEVSSNTANYQSASTAIGGDKLTSKVFWDNP